MRHRNKGYKRNDVVPYHQNHMNANTINVTNVTNITNVTQVNHVESYSTGVKRKHKRRKRFYGMSERPPKLTRFCASGGLLDYDKASRMDEGEICEEAAKVTSYAARGLSRSSGRFAGSAVNCVGGFAKSVCQVFGAIFDAFD